MIALLLPAAMVAALRTETTRHAAALVRMTLPGKWEGCIRKNVPDDFEVISRDEVVAETLRFKAAVERLLNA
jgi:hypothetical protein